MSISSVFTHKTGKQVLSVATTLLLAGCGGSGPGLEKVTGTVLLDGTPLSGAIVEFQPIKSGRPSVGFTNASGEFQLRHSRQQWGATPGEHIVSVTIEPDDESCPQPTVNIPERYNTASQVRYEVVDGKNHVELLLASEPADAKPGKKRSRTAAR